MMYRLYVEKATNGFILTTHDPASGEPVSTVFGSDVPPELIGKAILDELEKEPVVTYTETSFRSQVDSSL